jgi:hypothetical protein
MWLASPYELTTNGRHQVRVPAMDAFTAQLDADGGRWSETEIAGDRCIVYVDGASAATIKALRDDGRFVELVDRAAADAIFAPRQKPRIDVDGKLIFDGADAPTKPLDRVVAEATSRPVLQSVPRRSGAKGTGTLDNFDRANEDPLSNGGAWGGALFNSDQTLEVASNVAGGLDSTFSNSYYATSFGPDCECWCDIPTIGASSSVFLYLRVAGQGGTNTVDGYEVELNNSANTIALSRLDNEVGTQLGATTSFSPANGDSVGISAIGSTIEMWYIDASVAPGTWVSGGQRTDATYGAAGKIGVMLATTSDRIDNFGGGTVAAAAAGRAYPAMRQPLITW